MVSDSVLIVAIVGIVVLGIVTLLTGKGLSLTWKKLKLQGREQPDEEK